MSLSLMTIFELRDFSSTSDVKCYKDIILQSLIQFRNMRMEQTNDVIHEFNVKLRDDGALEIALTVIMTVAFVVCLVILKSRLWTFCERLLRLINIDSSFENLE